MNSGTREPQEPAPEFGLALPWVCFVVDRGGVFGTCTGICEAARVLTPVNKSELARPGSVTSGDETKHPRRGGGLRTELAQPKLMRQLSSALGWVHR